MCKVSEPVTKLIEGDCYFCQSKVTMQTLEEAYLYGKYYWCEKDDCLTDEQGHKFHEWRVDDVFRKHFRPWDLETDAKKGDIVVMYDPVSPQTNRAVFEFLEIGKDSDNNAIIKVANIYDEPSDSYHQDSPIDIVNFETYCFTSACPEERLGYFVKKSGRNFMPGDKIKYNGDVYLITGMDSIGYDVELASERDPDETYAAHISYKADIEEYIEVKNEEEVESNTSWSQEDKKKALDCLDVLAELIRKL